MSREKTLNTIWIITLFFGIAISFFGIHLPYTGLYNANNNYLALAAKNFLKFGFAELRFLPTYYVGAQLPADDVPYYLHHPVLMFLISVGPFILFGDANWVVHVVPFLFTAGSLYVLYRLVQEITDENIARWTVAFAAMFPFVSFFWKYMFFEQASLFFTLGVLWQCVRYWKTGSKKLLYGIGALSFLGGATDWYGAYLLFGFAYILLVRKNSRTMKSSLWYVSGTVAGLATYGAALLLTGNPGAAWEGYSARGLSSELTELRAWPVRLVIMVFVRIILYGSPFALLGIWFWIRKYVFEKRTTLLHDTGAVLAIIGSISILVLPVTVWGHSYFLYYLVPFLALVTAMWFVHVSKRSFWMALGVVLFSIVWSYGISTFKLHQVRKQVWKYDFGRDITAIVPAYETIGVMNYPGDVLQNYFNIQTVSLDINETDAWSKTATASALRFVVVTCSGVCTAEEKLFVEDVHNRVGVRTFSYGEQSGWLFDATLPGKQKNGGNTLTYPVKPYVRPVGIVSPVEWVYRKVRDFLGSTQI